MRKRNNRHYSIYIAWILLLLCLITGLKAGLEKNAAGKKESYPGISIQSRWEELWKTVSSKDREEESESKDKTPEKDADPQRNIRVLIMTDGYQQIVHREVEISAAGGYWHRTLLCPQPSRPSPWQSKGGQSQGLPGSHLHPYPAYR